MSTQNLKRTIGLIPATSIGLGAMLGAGIFVFPGLAGGSTGIAAILSFLIGGIIAILVAGCTAELATAMPSSGGGYFFISRSFGKFWGTVVGIAQWLGLIFACAFYMVSFGEYALTFLRELHVDIFKSTTILAGSFTIVLLLLNITGTKKVGRIQNIMVISLALMLVLIFSYGLLEYFGFQDNTSAVSSFAPNGTMPVFTTSALIFTSYLGFVQIANIGAEIKKPSINLPRSLIGSVIIALCLYIFVMLVCSFTFSHEELKNFGETATIEVARRMLGNWGALIVVFAGILAALSSANATLISASRSVFALSKDKVISPKASKINERFGTPHIALILVTAPVMLMFAQSNLEVFAEVASFLHLIIYAGICMAVLKLRLSNPAWYIPTFRMPAAKALALIGALCCVALVFFMQKTSILLGSGTLILSALYYILFIRKRKLDLFLSSPPHINLNLLNPRILIPVDISKEEKHLPDEIIEAIPISKTYLLGFKIIPEQSESEQSEEQFGEDAEKKLEGISSHLENENIDFETNVLFSEHVKNQIEELIDHEELQFILKLKPISNLTRLVIPIYDMSQINSELSTVIYRLQSKKPVKIKVLIFSNDDDDKITRNTLKRAIRNQLSLVHVQIDEFENHQKPKAFSNQFMQEKTEKTDVVIWSEAEPSQHELFMDILFEKESSSAQSPVIMILNKSVTRSKS